MKTRVPFGDLFVESGDDHEAAGKQHLLDALRVLQNRIPENDGLKRIPLPKKTIEDLTKDSFKFMQNHCPSAFERDNLGHVSRLVANMKIYGKDLKSFLDIQYQEVQLLAALHDLGKSRIADSMYHYLTTIFGPTDFINLRVLPHEFFSFYWIQVVGRERKLNDAQIQLLMDQVANHNFGPDLSSPENVSLLAKKQNGQLKHWWLEHWKEWTKVANKSGIKVGTTYGHTKSPLANTLVLFDRVDGAHPHSWEKFLNQDLLSGKLEFTPVRIHEILEDANNAAREQVLAVGRQLHKNFLPKKLKTPIEDFSPYADAMHMLVQSEHVVNRLNACNSAENREKFKATGASTILYQNSTGHWHRVDAMKTPNIHGIHFEWVGSKWKEIQSTENPVELLLETIYNDWKKAA